MNNENVEDWKELRKRLVKGFVCDLEKELNIQLKIYKVEMAHLNPGFLNFCSIKKIEKLSKKIEELRGEYEL